MAIVLPLYYMEANARQYIESNDKSFEKLQQRQFRSILRVKWHDYILI